jgi:hypothetical protein
VHTGLYNHVYNTGSTDNNTDNNTDYHVNINNDIIDNIDNVVNNIINNHIHMEATTAMNMDDTTVTGKTKVGGKTSAKNKKCCCGRNDEHHKQFKGQKIDCECIKCKKMAYSLCHSEEGYCYKCKPL